MSEERNNLETLAECKQSPLISVEEGFELYHENKLFREYLNTGLFKHNWFGFSPIIEIRSASSIKVLMFGEKTEPGDKGVARKTFSNTPNNSEALEQIRLHVEAYEKIHARQQTNRKTANEALLDHFAQEKWNTAIFQEKTLLSPVDYSRVKQKDHIFTLRSYVAMAVGLQLSFQEFQNIINLAGISLIVGDREHDAYSYLLTALQGKGIDECNDFLEKIGVETLGTQTRK